MMNVYGTTENFDRNVKNASGTMYNAYKTTCNCRTLNNVGGTMNIVGIIYGP